MRFHEHVWPLFLHTFVIHPSKDIMQEDKPALETLKEFAGNSGREIVFSEQQHEKMPLHPGQLHIRRCYIRAKNREELFYYCFSDTKFTGDYANLSGIFFPLDVSPIVTADIRKKDIIDRFAMLGRKSRWATGVKDFDSNVLVKAPENKELQSVLNNRSMQQQLLNALETEEGLRILINPFSIDFIPELRQRSFMAVLSPRTWMLEAETIEALFQNGRKLKDAAETN
jgi:hypothetical protein